VELKCFRFLSARLSCDDAYVIPLGF